jgi:hypothetical protein
MTAIRHPVSQTRNEKNVDAGTTPVPEQGDPVRYQNTSVPAEMTDAGMPMPMQRATYYMCDVQSQKPAFLVCLICKIISTWFPIAPCLLQKKMHLWGIIVCEYYSASRVYNLVTVCREILEPFDAKMRHLFLMKKFVVVQLPCVQVILNTSLFLEPR